MTTRDDARRTANEPPAEGLRLVPPRPEPGDRDPDRLPDRDPDRSSGRDRGDHDRDRDRDGDRSAPANRPSPLPERLYAARERKGVDLYRAERDTKIRARYLSALERGEYKELPGDVYTKGFLRNYALYLGLDPDEVVGQWRRERGDVGAVRPVISVPKPIAQPRPGLQFSPGIVVAALLTILIVGVGVWLGSQVMRFAKPPTLELTTPREATLALGEDATSFTFKGTSIAGATITVDMAGGSRTASADTTGAWTMTVDLRRGRNEFKFDAVDPETGKHAEQPAQVVITVPVSQIQGPTVKIDGPADGTTFQNGAIPLQGTATGAPSVTITASYDGPIAGVAGPSAPPSGAPSVGPPPVTAPVGSDGKWDTGASPLQLTTGRWTITATATNEAGSATLPVHVTVGYKGVNLVVKVKGGSAWIKVWVDGKIDDTVGRAGRVYRDGQVLTFTGKESVEVRTGSSGATFFTLNGKSLGALGKRGIPETWLFDPPAAPNQTQRS
jgi:cytoskeletal protein RodZ